MVPGWFFTVPDGFLWLFMVPGHVFGSRFIFMVFQGSRLVFIVPGRFYGFSWFQVGFHSFSRFFIVPCGVHGSRSNFHDSRWIFIVIFGSRLVSIRAERRRREVRH